MPYFVSTELKYKGRWKLVYLWQSDLWRESRNEALSFTSEAEAQEAVERLEASSRKLRNIKIITETTVIKPYRRKRHVRPTRHR
ncbi:hypothetical protein QUF64_15445 [Anaerolineales bacterium HSG6]|nr:hypothetical protein [Anaerolineales bacterium HSG6]MDM8530883.1 hypothetical protein [Anaerolineales bacterium HSG25]